MSIINQSARVPAPSQREKIIPPLSRGLADTSGNVDAMSGYAKTLTNCTYSGGVLRLGRPHLSYQVLGTKVDAEVVAQLDDTNIQYDSGGDSAPASEGSYVGDRGYMATAAKVYSREIVSSAYAYVSIFDTSVESTGDVRDIIYFNDELIILTDNQLFRHSDSKIYYCGSIHDTSADAGTPTDQPVYTGNSYTATGIGAGKTYYCKVNTVSVLVKKVGTITGTCKASITYNSVTYDSNDVDVATGVSTAYALTDFVFPDLPEVIPGSGGFSIVFTATAGDSSNYVAVSDPPTSATAALSVNGTEAPTGCQLAVFYGRLYIGGDLSTPKVWFSNYNDPDDYYKTSTDGLVTYGGYLTVDNDASSQSYGVFSHSASVVTCGYVNGDYQATFWDKNHTMVARITGARLGGRYSVSTKYGIVFIDTSGHVGVITALGMDKQAEVKWLSQQVQIQLDDFSADINGTPEIAYNPKYSQIYVYAGKNAQAAAVKDEVYVLQMPTLQWTKYDFYGKNITYMRDNRFGCDDGTEFSFADEFGQDDFDYSPTIISPPMPSTTITYTVQTHKLRLSRFHRTRLHKILWDIENDGFSGTLTVVSEKGNADVTYAVTGNPPVPVSTRVKDSGMSFKLSSVTIDEYTNVGEISCMLSTDGRTNT